MEIIIKVSTSPEGMICGALIALAIIGADIRPILKALGTLLSKL
jgi:hypothetical protein